MKKMLAKPIVYVLLIISATQVPTTPGVVVTGLRCAKKIQWYRNVTKELKKVLDKFVEMLATKEISEHDRLRIKAEYDHIDNMKSDLMKKLDPDLEKLSHVLDDKIQYNLCAKEMKVYLKLRRHLILAGVKLKSNMLNILDRPEVSKHVKNEFNKSLSEIVNWLFETDVNMLRDVNKLRNSSSSITENGRQLEEEWTLRSDGKVEVPLVVEPQYHDEDIADKKWDKLMQEEKKEILEHRVYDETGASPAVPMASQSDAPVFDYFDDDV